MPIKLSLELKESARGLGRIINLGRTIFSPVLSQRDAAIKVRRNECASVAAFNINEVLSVSQIRRVPLAGGVTAKNRACTSIVSHLRRLAGIYTSHTPAGAAGKTCLGLTVARCQRD